MKKRTVAVAAGLAVLFLGLMSFAYVDSRALARDTSVADSSLGPNLVRIGSDHFRLDWNVSATGGGSASSSHFGLASTTGQPVIGNSSSTHFGHRAGYWQTFEYRVYLPLILRNA